MCTDLWKWVQLPRTERSPPLSAAVNTNSWQSQTLHSLSRHNLGGKRRGEDRQGHNKKENLITLIPVMYVVMSKIVSQGKSVFFFISFFVLVPFFFKYQPAFSPHSYRKNTQVSGFLPRALNICMPPYFPSKSTVLLRGLNALHIRTKTTSKQPGRAAETDCQGFVFG